MRSYQGAILPLALLATALVPWAAPPPAEAQLGPVPVAYVMPPGAMEQRYTLGPVDRILASPAPWRCVAIRDGSEAALACGPGNGHTVMIQVDCRSATALPVRSFDIVVRGGDPWRFALICTAAP
jgi:hypothetical protein